MPSMNEDIERYPVFMVNSKGGLKQIDIKSTDDYNHFEFELHHFVPKSMRKNNLELYAGKGYRGLENWELLFNRKKWRTGVYENRTGDGLVG